MKLDTVGLLLGVLVVMVVLNRPKPVSEDKKNLIFKKKYPEVN